MFELIHSFFSSGSFIPHEPHYLWQKEVVGLHLVSDLLIAIAYYSIPFTLLYFVEKRKDLPFNWVFWLFSFCIVACGTTHLLAVWTLWQPIYWVSGVLKAITAIASILTAIVLFFILPQAMALPSPAALSRAYDELEHRVQERTADLAAANQALQAEIIERQRAETKLQEGLTLQQAILDSANYTIISTAVDGTITTFNQAAERSLGYTAAEVVGKTTPIIIHEPEEVMMRSQELSQELGIAIAPGLETFVAKVRLGEADEREWSYIRKDGSRFPVLLSITALRDAENQITGFLGIGSDITPRQQSEAELRWKEALLRSMADASPLAFFVVDDRTDEILYFNRRFCEIWGIESLEAPMRRGELKHNDILPSCFTVLADVTAFAASCKPLQSEENRTVLEDEIPFNDGRVIRRFSGQIRDEHDRYFGRLYLFEDITERRSVERLKDEFVSIVSHELRTPLTSISAALDLLAGGVLQSQPDEAQRMLNIAASNTDRLVRLINDILDIERIESGKIDMLKHVCNTSELMMQSVEAMQEMATQAGVQIQVEPLSAQIWADSDRMIQVLTNLLSNAIKFSPPGSTVSLTAERQTYEPSLFALQPASYVLFKVADQGRGIPEDKLESIFERFQQVDASDSRQRGGTGLGLAICRSILQQHGGQIWATSTLGVGSTFFFMLPISNAISPVQSCAVTPITQTPLVLACDDDPSVRLVIQALLERQGYRVLSVGSGAEAVEQAMQAQPAVILLNLIMPGGMNGWETLAALRQQPETRSIPVIILSGVSPNAKVPHPEVSDWIVKPPEPRQLYQALERALAKPDQTLHVLIVEDDRDLAQVLSTLFARHRIVTHCAHDGREAIALSQELLPDLLVLDLGLPEYDGFAVVDCLQQHPQLQTVPLVIYTARDLSEQDRDRLRLGETLILTKGRISPQMFEQRVIQLLNRIVTAKQGGEPHDCPSRSDCG